MEQMDERWQTISPNGQTDKRDKRGNQSKRTNEANGQTTDKRGKSPLLLYQPAPSVQFFGFLVFGFSPLKGGEKPKTGILVF